MYQFTEDCMTGIPEIDEEHRQLFDIINEAFALVGEESAAVPEAKSLLRALRKYAEIHFAHEEEYMEKLDDPELPRQRREHQAFTEKVENIPLEELDEENGTKVLKEMLDYLSRWLYHHILGSDIMIGQIRPVTEKEDPFAFTDKYRTGIKLVDEEHETLFRIVREANDLIQEELLHDKYDEIMGILDKLKEYTIHHFQDEEDYMERIGYAGLEAQQRAHRAFVDKLNDINLDDVDDNQQEYLIELVNFLLSWLVNHIQKVDKLIPAEQ
ncbi:MAG: bacteriohemerythrin [Acetatifactor sp.]